MKIRSSRLLFSARIILVSTFLVVAGLSFPGHSTYAGDVCASLFQDVDPESAEQPIANLRECRAMILDRAAQQDVSALILKSQLALRGVSEKKSPRNARMALEAASDQGSPLAKRLLADLLAGRLGADQEDFLKAETLYLEAARLGDASATSKLAHLYADGKVPNRSAADAEAMFKTAGDGDAGAKLGRAKIILSRPATQESTEQASGLLLEAARLGNPEASFLFAMLNLNNVGYSDLGASELEKLLCLSADQGYAPAMFECAKHLLAGSDQPTAIALLNQAANVGHIDSMEYLADYYSKTGNASDLQNAKKLWFQAATLGSDAAKLALHYRFDSLTKAEQLKVNGAFSTAAAFSTDIGRIMLGNHYLSIVDRGQAGEYIKGEHWYYEAALDAFSMVAKSPNEQLAEQASKVANSLSSQKSAYEGDLEARRLGEKVKFWVGVATAAVAILSLSGNNSASSSPAPSYDSCAGINGLAWYGVSPGAIALGGCNPYSFN